MTIKELFAEPQFEGIVFYLTAQGYSFPLELAEFDFDELFFVPGISDEAIDQCRALLSDYITNKENQEVKSVDSPHSQTCSSDEPAKSDVLPDTAGPNDDLSIVVSALIDRLAAAIASINSRGQLDALRSAVSGPKSYGTQYDPELLTMLCDEIGAFLEIPDAEHSENNDYSPEERERLASVSVEDIYAGVPRGKALIRYCRENGISTLLDLGNISFSDLKAKGLGPDSLKNCEEIYRARRDAVLAGEISIPEPEKTAHEWFTESLSKLKDRDRDCIEARAQGETLQTIGTYWGLTRERVRQVVNKTIRKLSKSCEAVFKELAAGQISISTPDLKAVFHKQSQIDIIAFVLENTSSVRYFSFADKYVDAEVVPDDWNLRLQQIAQDIVGDSINYYENLELIDEHLSSEGLSFIDSIDFMGFLLERGYKELGDYVVKKSQAYRNVCLDVIRRHFPDGIKLDSDENNEDMARLRSIVQKEFGDAGLAESNRALTARVSPALILCGRGKYISPENVDADISLLEQIVDYINASHETSFYFSELFSAFSGRLLAQTDIDNANFLHGVLKLYYPDDFNFERDLLVKKGMTRTPFDQKLAQLLVDNHHAMRKAEIQKRLTGATDLRIFNAALRIPKIIQWEYNEYNHMDNLSVSSGDTARIGTILQSLTEGNSGYCSEAMLFSAVSKEMPEFIAKNAVQNCHNLFYIVSYLFGKEYRFSRPHIASPAFPNIELTNGNVARFFVGHTKTLLYSDLVQLSQRVGWAYGAFTMVLYAVEQEYCRISLNDYVLRSDFHIEDDALARIKQIVSDLIAHSGYYGIFAIYNYDQFPSVPYEWNEFLLQTILETYHLGFKLLEPNTKDRRYKRGIIVSESRSSDSFEEFVIEQMKADQIQAVPENEFSSYLRRKGLVLTTNIPQELFDGDGVRLENGMFVYD